ncbi:MAG: hypothetical protein JO042_11115, partial [Sinobacteraceae bacterium]|nr:hypothetical protein [Nevskiaceae bacterium]
AAVHALARWTRDRDSTPDSGDRPAADDGRPDADDSPAIAPRFSVQIVSSPTPAAVIERDPQTGNAIGGIRFPQLAVPIETLTGIRPPKAVQGNPNCVLFGATDPWDHDTDPWDGVAGLDPSPTPEPSLGALYGSKHDYLVRYKLATSRSVLEGFLLPDDAHEVIDLAEAAHVPNGAASNADIIPDP